MDSGFMLRGLQTENVEVLGEILGRILGAQTTCWLQKTDGESRKSGLMMGGWSADFHLIARRPNIGFVTKPCSPITQTTAKPTTLDESKTRFTALLQTTFTE